MNLSETLQASSSWSVDVHVTVGICSDNASSIFFSHSKLSHFSASKDYLGMYLVCPTPPTVFMNHFETMQASFS